MRLVYVCHPVRGDVESNLQRAKRWLRWIWETYDDVFPVAPWVSLCELGLVEETARPRGLIGDCEVAKRCDELWLVGGQVSPGMQAEAYAADSAHVKVVDMTLLGEEPPQ